MAGHRHHPPLIPPEIEGVDPLSLEVFRCLKRTTHLQRQMMMRTMAEGFSFPRVGLLRVVGCDDGISQRDLADEMHLARPTITTMLNGLEEEGYVERRADAADRRLTRVYLTDKGRAVHERAKEAFASHVNETIGGMDRTDRSELIRLLTQLNDRVEQELAAEKEGAVE